MQKNHIDFQQTKKFMNKIDFLDGALRKELLPPEEILSRLSMSDLYCRAYRYFRE